MVKVFNLIPFMAKLLSVEKYFDEYLIDEVTSKVDYYFTKTLWPAHKQFFCKMNWIDLKSVIL